ncbi:MAG TPA: MurR/RpiR family transcriptional regulator [Conexibacter sp.]|nr:MurR/RpiR family transcriptional regulator [Conexibacter sp.]
MSTDLPPTDLGAAREVQARIHAHLSSLQTAEVRVARVVLEQPNVVIYKSASEVGQMASTSSATVIRCAQKMGFKGFHDLKLALANELAVFEQSRAQEERAAGDPRSAVLVEITRAGAESVRDAGALVDADAFDAVVSAITDARRVLFFGVGTSAPLCQDAAYRFSAIGVLAEAPADVHVQHVQARLLTDQDVAVIVSHTGSTRETLAAAAAARGAGATTVAITSFAVSPLTEQVDHTIVAGSRELALRLEAMASRLAHLALLDALLVAVAGRDERRSASALEHYTDVLGEHRL